MAVNSDAGGMLQLIILMMSKGGIIHICKSAHFNMMPINLRSSERILSLHQC